jgi:hypothetical protein
MISGNLGDKKLSGKLNSGEKKRGKNSIEIRRKVQNQNQNQNPIQIQNQNRNQNQTKATYQTVFTSSNEGGLMTE